MTASSCRWRPTTGSAWARTGLRALQHAKRGLEWLTFEQARRYRKQNLRINMICPGLIRSEVAKQLADLPVPLRTAYWLGQPFMLSDKEGAEDCVYLAASNRVKTISGNFFSRKYVLRHQVIEADRQRSEALWEACSQVVGHVNVQA